jgi:hypothetical protein
MTTDVELLQEISEKLDRVIALLALHLDGEEGSKVDRLLALKLDYTTISLVTGLSTNAIAVRVSRAKKANAR